MTNGEGYNWKKDESNVGPAMLFHGNIKPHVNKSVGKKVERGALEEVNKNLTLLNVNNAMLPYTNVSANDDIRWKKADTNRWELSDKLENV